MVTPARKRTLSLLTNPFILAAIPTIALFLVIPVLHQPYILELKSSARIPANHYCSYIDLDGDGNTEKITAFDYPNGSGITVSEGPLTLNQWNISGTFSFPLKSTLYIAADCNNDSIKELYLFSINGDSILLHSVEDSRSAKSGIRARLIDVTGHGSAAPDPRIVAADPMDLDGDGRLELVFGIAAGFSKQPRKVYAYYPVNDSLVASSPVGGFMLGILQADLDDDGTMEIMPHGYAAGNIPPSMAKYHDESAWFTVLDRNLEPVFEPVPFSGNFVIATPMVTDSNEGKVREILVSSMDPDSLSSLWTFTPYGEITYRKSLPFRSIAGFVTLDGKREPVYALIVKEGGIVLLDHNGRQIKSPELQGSPSVIQNDIDLDGIPEIIAISYETGSIHVYRSGFRKPAVATVGGEFTGEILCSVSRIKDTAPALYLQAGTSQVLFEYRRNRLYYLTFGIYPMVYGAFIAFVLLIQATQRRSMARREEERKKISELQLALIRNQLDPHFTLNALNSVLHLVEHSDREKARESLLKFSGLYRDLLLSAGKSRRSLGEELEFCHEYLSLEKTRYGSRFDFSFNTPPEINYELPVPKLVIQLFAENSVKHGVAALENGGILSVSVSGSGNELTILIKDNGVGRARAAGDNAGSAGKGMSLMNELFDLCNRYYEDEHLFKVLDLTGSDGQPSGTEVAVTIRYRHETIRAGSG